MTKPMTNDHNQNALMPMLTMTLPCDEHNGDDDNGDDDDNDEVVLPLAALAGQSAKFGK